MLWASIKFIHQVNMRVMFHLKWGVCGALLTLKDIPPNLGLSCMMLTVVCVVYVNKLVN